LKKWLIIAGIVVVAAVVLANVLGRGPRAVEVEMQETGIGRLVAEVSASGTLTPKRKVDVSAETIGRITRLAVAEGDTVAKGDLLLEIDPAEYQSMARSYEAAVNAQQANLRLARASAEKADLDLRRARELHAAGLGSQEQLDAAETNARVESARVAAAEASLRQARANLDKARNDLAKVTITASMAGIVTRLNVEEGENAIMGTLNNPGTVLLTISDMSTMEAEVDVDETEVVDVALGQPVSVEIDAFPDTSFAGVVTEIGNSPIYTSTGQNQQAVDFKVTVTLTDRVAGVRPGLSAKAEITTAVRDSALTVPIGAVVVREWPPSPAETSRGRRPRAAAADTVEREEVEGVFVVVDDEALFRPVELGIAGEEDFEVLSGLTADDTVVKGPFRALRDLRHGDRVKRGKDGARRGRD